MTYSIESVYERMDAWCRDRKYEGYDPFDGLNSRLFQSSPLRHSRIARLAWTQLFKRLPFNLRRIAGIPAEKNSKGIALFALATLARFRRERTDEAEREARTFLNELFASRLDGFNGAAWGYNFDWQGRAFFAPRGTPTIVPTAFAVRALVEAARDFGDETYLKTARSSCDFILNDLNRIVESADEVCWSYTPLDRTRVLNASLLAAETLASVSSLTSEKDLLEWAVRGARFVVRRQRPDGSWPYGEADFQSWSDNFHTAFILTSLTRITDVSIEARDEFSGAIKRGYTYWRENFFLADGWAKYYHNRLYPFDAHSVGASIVALLEMRSLDDDHEVFAQKVALWSIKNLFDASGFFYYQRRRFYTVRTPYMRWSEAWMMYALARLMEVKDTGHGTRDAGHRAQDTG